MRHLSGHGGADTIELGDEDGQAVAVTAAQLIDTFQAAGKVVPMVFVSACHSGDSASGFALELHRRGVARVIAMSGSVSDRYASDLAAAFYEQLSRASSPRAGVALAAARRAVEDARQRDPASTARPEWATATLLLAGEDGAILDSDLDQVELCQLPVYAVGDAVPMLGMGELIGRRRELRAVMRAVRADTRFTAQFGEVAGVGLTGIGGIGKSSVAGRAMARLATDGWVVSATTGVWSLQHVCRQLSTDLQGSQQAWARELRTRLQDSEQDDRARLQLLRTALRDHRLVVVFDNFEDNLTDDATAFADAPTATIFRLVAEGCARGRILVTSRYPIPGCMDMLHEVSVDPLTPAETSRLFLRLQGLKHLGRDDVRLIRSLIGGHPRALELLDALLRHGISVTRLRPKLHALADREGIDTGEDRDLANAIDLTVRLAARDIVLDALVGALDDVERETLLQVAVSSLPVERDDLATMLHELASAPQIAHATNRLIGLSLLTRVDDGVWVHRWTAEALRPHQTVEEHRTRCRRAGQQRCSRIQAQARDISEGIEATQNFLDAQAFDDATAVARSVCNFLAQASTLDRASFARHVREILPTNQADYKFLADHEASALLALGDTNAAIERYVELVRDHEQLVAGEPDRADYQRDLSVSYSKLGDLQGALGNGAQALELFTRSLRIAERLAAAEPDRADYQSDLSVSYDRLGDLQGALGNGAEALELFTRSLQIRECLAAAEPASAEYQRDLSVSYEKLGDLQGALGNGAEALELFTRSLHIAERLVAAEPDRADYQSDLSVSYNRLGDLQRVLGNGAEALELFTRSLRIAERLAAAEPDRAGYQRDLSISYNRLAAIAEKAGEREAAREYLSADLEIARRLLELQPASADAAVDVAISLAQIAELEADGESRRAEAKAILQQLQAGNRLDAQSERLLVQLESPRPTEPRS